MELLDHLALGFDTALSLQNLLYCGLGAVIGTLIGVLPGLGPVATIAMLIPITFTLPPVAGLIMLAGIYYGAQYGGSTTAILVNLPGETSSVVTCLDGYQMARSGRAGQALAIAALGSFFAGCVAIVVLAGFAPILSNVAFEFGPAEYFSLMVLGLIGAIVLASGSVIRAICMTITGLLLGMVGTDVNSGVVRYGFGVPQLVDGLEFATVAMGVFGFTEIMNNIVAQRQEREVFLDKVRHLYPQWEDIKRAAPAVLRGTVIGSALGILPGGGATLSSFVSYSMEKKLSKNPEMFGKGEIRGVAAPESANNAASQTAFIPMLTLGIPSNSVMALMLGAMIVHNIQPGPQVMTSNPELFWGLVASMWLGNLALVVLNLPLVGIWIKLLKVPYRVLFPAILMICSIGVYSLNYNVFDIWMTALFGLLGYIWSKLNCEGGPLLLGLVLGPMMEENIRRALILSRGDFSTFVTSPLSAALLFVAAVLALVVLLPSIRRKREEAFV